ncbi:deoxyguanosinetriphosphate triphosphohydrolase [Xylanimonas cellulosilytica DSM 15894]|uniref:Deoxyguanosinetriphosphate triphosphohydrolase-like protein n=1 Tax=Xylanimonas cellulosilytica (strain DSM 15894 / JCM 12276 / CECT 5975 / KCTC 9989 / LMG 20990 / NBRC 107835 / XIL07) TaxID=446471 RepID=D1BUG2_XYLCX|nr:deoxyguanosinetriphosphate triphosphohydrolase [Xylanimonas cellulosilytica]ACZ31175.1 deoxyguanosinetriphosphate triphosphohydrolase [Xylanimonas cellulosilytica DSM 15894]
MQTFEQGAFDPDVVGGVPRPAEGEQGPGAYGDHDVERFVQEPPKSRLRTPFERDRARVVHSSAMRRLGAKTQVLTPGTDDFVRTRLTHSLEVAQIGREMGRALGCDPDVVDAACLTHDLGHPPFGHNGERALAAVADPIGGFEGNAQTLRLLTRLEPKVPGAGLNLTRASLDASVKYPWAFGAGPRRPDGTATGKFGVYPDDAPVFTWLRKGAPDGVRSMEAQVMDLADDIAYSVHDVEDAVVGGRLDLGLLESADERARVVAAVQVWYGAWHSADALEAALGRLRESGLLMTQFDGSRGALAHLKDLTSSLIGRFSGAAQAATREVYGPGALTRYSARLLVPEETQLEILALKGVAVAYVMAPREEEPLYQAQREIVADLVEVLAERAPVALEAPFAADWAEADDDAARLRVVVDQVASLTDVSALQWHARLVGR